ncbi:MAG: ketoacyl-ACP synthase III [Bacteroidota bacterium]|nr:ketoacyl-ACP synthase III [Bacteroidota bacterium]
MHAYIKGISYYLPPETFSNADYFAEFPEQKNNPNLDRIGVQERRVVPMEVTSSDLGAEAAETFFKEHSVDRSSIDFLLFCSLEFDHVMPGSCMVIHKKTNLPVRCGAMDVIGGCSGYIYSLSIAKGLIESSGFRNILLITSSTLTKLIHPKDKASRFVFGDGAAATLISAREKSWGIGDFEFGSLSSHSESIRIKDGGGRSPFSKNSYLDRADEYGNVTNDAHFYMDGPAVFNFGLKAVPALISAVLEKSNVLMKDVDLFILHQANLFLIDSIRKKAEIPEDKIFNFMGPVGNTASATIPIALYEARKAGRIKEGQIILLAGFGVGLSTGATLIKV